jgi:hypothetical protein
MTISRLSSVFSDKCQGKVKVKLSMCLTKHEDVCGIGETAP